MDFQPQPATTKPRRWTPAEERLLVEMRDDTHKDFTAIAKILNRSPAATTHRYTLIKQQEEGSSVAWTSAMDEQIIDGRGSGLTLRAISTTMRLPPAAVTNRWNTLVREKKVPDDVRAVWKRKGEVVFSPEEDEEILRVWVTLMEDDERLVRMVGFPGKSRADVRRRRVELVRGSSSLYRMLVGVGDGREDGGSHALEKELGGLGYARMG